MGWEVQGKCPFFTSLHLSETGRSQAPRFACLKWGRDGQVNPHSTKRKKHLSFLFDVHNWTFNAVKASLKGFKAQ